MELGFRPIEWRCRESYDRVYGFATKAAGCILHSAGVRQFADQRMCVSRDTSGGSKFVAKRKVDVGEVAATEEQVGAGNRQRVEVLSRSKSATPKVVRNSLLLFESMRSELGWCRGALAASNATTFTNSLTRMLSKCLEVIFTDE